VTGRPVGDAVIAVESPLANVCDTNYTSIAKMPKRYLPTAAFGGVHDQLRELTTSR
jgi:hypothetical protein